MVTEPRTLLVLRAGQLGLDKDEFFGSLSDADLKYVTIGGEYRYTSRSTTPGSSSPWAATG